MNCRRLGQAGGENSMWMSGYSTLDGQIRNTIRAAVIAAVGPNKFRQANQSKYGILGSIYTGYQRPVAGIYYILNRAQFPLAVPERALSRL